MFEIKPTFLKEKIEFWRDEKDGKKLILLKEFPELHELIINSTTADILSLANGENTVQEIIEKLYAKYDVEKEILSQDVANCLSKYAKLGVIEWPNGNDPFIVANERLFENGNKIRIANEGDYKILYDYISSYDTKNAVFFLPYEDLQYNDINLRSRLFYRMESFYILFDNKNKMNCVIGVMNDFSKTTNIPLLTFISNVQNTDDVSFLLRYLIKTYNESSNKINKIRAVLKFEDIEKIEELLISNSFKLEAKLKDELGKNNDVLYYAYFY